MQASCPLTRWDTPLSNAIAVSLISAVHDESLCLTLEVEQFQHRDLWCLRFTSSYSYSVAKLELSPEKRSALYKEIMSDGWTHFHNHLSAETEKRHCQQSDRVSRESTDLTEVELLDKMRATVSHMGNYSMHFVIITNTAVIDVYSNRPPQWQKIGRKRNVLAARLS